jgi:tetratricopeptide (TPR) repeat protein
MSVQAAPKTESDAIIERLLALDDGSVAPIGSAQNPTIAWHEIVRRLTERVWQEVRIDTHRAQAAGRSSPRCGPGSRQSGLLARSFRAKANAMYALDEHTEAVYFHEQAIVLFEQTGDEAELARTLSGSIQSLLLLLGWYDQALAAGERAGAIFRQQGNSRRLARLEINIGNIYHRQDRFPRRWRFTSAPIEQMLAHDDAEGLAAVLSNLSLCHISLNDFPKALELHQVARRHCEQKNMPILVAYADYNIAYLYFLRGEYGRSIQMLRDASASANKAHDAYQLALCNLDLVGDLSRTESERRSRRTGTRGQPGLRTTGLRL